MQSNHVGDETTLLAAAWRYRWLVIAIVLLSLPLGIAVGNTLPTVYVAGATLLVENPSDSNVFGPQRAASDEAYMAAQTVLLGSEAVANRATELLSELEPPVLLSAEELIEGLTSEGDPDTGVITVVMRADNATVARNGANTVGLAYNEVRTEEVKNAARAEAERLNAGLRLVATDLEAIASQIDELRTSNSIRLDQRLDSASLDLLSLIDRRAEATEEELVAIRLDRADLLEELGAAQLLQALVAQEPALAALLQTRTDLLGLQRELKLQLNQVNIEEALASSGVVSFAPSREAFRRGLALIPAVAIVVILGAAAAVGLAYHLATRSRRFGNRLEPETVLDSPLLAEIPDFREEGLKSDLPVEANPLSRSAEAFRFAAVAVDIKMTELVGRPQPSTQAEMWAQSPAGVKVVAVVSATLGNGKTIVTANTALAASRSGSRVLVIDGDFSSQQVSRLLLGKVSVSPGITDVVMEGVPFDRAFETVDAPNGTVLTVMGRGQVPVAAATLFRSANLKNFMKEIREEYDMVLIDAPPLLQVAYAGALLRLADGAVVVVPHNSSPSDLEEVRIRLEFAGTPAFGYVYNRAPLRRELAGPEGSSVGDVAAAELQRVDSTLRR